MNFERTTCIVLNSLSHCKQNFFDVTRISLLLRSKKPPLYRRFSMGKKILWFLKYVFSAYFSEAEFIIIEAFNSNGFSPIVFYVSYWRLHPSVTQDHFVLKAIFTHPGELRIGWNEIGVPCRIRGTAADFLLSLFLIWTYLSQKQLCPFWNEP